MLDKIEDAIEEIRRGRLVIVVDDEDRENEGDFITAARNATPEVVNFMSKYGRGLICAPLIEERCDELGLELMVNNNTALHETAFTVSVDLLGHGCTTGISAHDRSNTILALVNKSTKPGDLGRPGHIFPLRAKKGGVLRRAGHTEATIDLARLAGYEPAGILVEIMNEDGSMARLPELNTSNEHMALIKGEWKEGEPVMVRVHSSCFTGDILGSLRCDCGDQLHKAMQMVEANKTGIILYMNQEGRGIGLVNKLKAYKLQEDGMDTVEANLHLGFPMDKRDYGVGAQILRYLGVRRLKLISNNPKKRTGLSAYGLEIVETIPIQIPSNPHNERYLNTKRDKLGHEMKI